MEDEVGAHFVLTSSLKLARARPLCQVTWLSRGAPGEAIFNLDDKNFLVRETLLYTICPKDLETYTRVSPLSEEQCPFDTIRWYTW